MRGGVTQPNVLDLIFFLHDQWMGEQMEVIMIRFVIWRGGGIEAGEGFEEWNDRGN